MTARIILDEDGEWNVWLKCEDDADFYYHKGGFATKQEAIEYCRNYDDCVIEKT